MKQTATKKYVICVKNEGYEVSLECRKIYRVKPNKSAAEEGLIRVIDESGQSYLYPENFFIAVRLPGTIVRALAA